MKAEPDLFLSAAACGPAGRDSRPGTQVERAAPATAPGVAEIYFKQRSSGDLSVTCWTKTQAREGGGANNRLEKRRIDFSTAE